MKDDRRRIGVLPTLSSLGRSPSSAGRSSCTLSRGRFGRRELLRSNEESRETRRLLLPPRRPPIDLPVSAWADAASASSILKLLLRLALRLLLLLRVNKSRRFTTRGSSLTTSDVAASLIVQWREKIRYVDAEITSN
jgi:hypothetical protein